LNEHNTVFAQSRSLYVIGLPLVYLSPKCKRYLDRFRILQGSLVDRPTDHAARSFTIGGICLHSTAM